MPVLTIIAGPNGAGKSTYSKELLSESGIEAFDFDKEFYSIFSSGLKRLDETFELFDLVSIYNSDTNSVDLVCVIEPGEGSFVLKGISQLLRPFLKKLWTLPI